jgi:hypothetical protein
MKILYLYYDNQNMHDINYIFNIYAIQDIFDDKKFNRREKIQNLIEEKKKKVFFSSIVEHACTNGSWI